MDRRETNRRTAHHAEVWRANARRRRIITTPLVPVNAHIMASALTGWRWWWPHLEALIGACPPAAVGRAGRVPGSPLRRRNLFATVNLLLMGREADIAAGVSSPGDRADQLGGLLAWVDEVCVALRGDGVALSFDGGGADPLLPPGEVDRLHALCVDLGAGEATRLGRALATLELFSLLMHVESRAGRDDHGPYPLAGGGRMVVRELRDLGRNPLPWSDVADAVPHGTVVAAMVLPADVEVEIDDFGNTFTTPERYLETLSSAVLASADGQGGLTPLDGAGVDAQLAAVRSAQTALYRRVMGMTREEQIVAGVTMHFRLPQPFAELAGLQLDWSAPAAAQELALELDDDRARDLIVRTSAGAQPYTPIPMAAAGAS